MFKIFRNLKNFLSGLVSELKEVTWIKFGTVVRYTASVVVFLTAATLLIILVDKIFLVLRNLIIPI